MTKLLTMVTAARDHTNLHQKLIDNFRQQGYKELKDQNEKYAEQTSQEMELLKSILEYLYEGDGSGGINESESTATIVFHFIPRFLILHCIIGNDQ